MTNGTATLQSSSSNTVNISFTDKAILSWGVTTNAAGRGVAGAAIADGTTLTNFIVDSGDTWNFASSGSVLNKVVAGNNTTASILGGSAQAAVINGQVMGSSAKVYVLANGGILVGNSAQLNTQGLVLSTINGENDGTFITLGDLMYSGTSTGTISLGTLSAGGNITATAGSITTAGGSVGGDFVLKAVTAASGITLSTASATSVGGNLSVTTNNGTIAQTSGLTVGTQTGTQTATFNSGTAATTLSNIANDFERVVANTSATTGTVTLRDANIITLGASSIGGDLDVKVGGKTNTTAIATDGAVAVTGNAWLDSSVSSNSGITVANSSSVGGYVTAQTSGGNISLTTAGNLTLGNISSNVTATQLTSATNTNGAAWTALTATGTVAAGSLATLTLATGTSSPIFTGNVTLTIAAPTAAATPPALTAGAFTLGAAATLTNTGSGYTAAPTVQIVGGGGSGATATAVLGAGATADQVVGVTITGVGAGYTTAPTIIIGEPSVGAVAAQARAVRDGTTGLITSVEITNAGVGYGATVPTIAFPAVSTANNYSAQGNITANTTGALATSAAGFTINSASGIKTSANVTLLRGTTVTTGAGMTVTGNSGVTLTSTAGAITIGGGVITANRVTANASGGDILLATSGNITTNGRAQDPNSFTATGNVLLDNIGGTAIALGLGSGQQVNLNAANAQVRSANNLTLGNTSVTGNVTLRAGTTTTTGSNRVIQLGRGDATDATPIVIGGVLTATTDGSGGITDNNDSRQDIFGGLNLQTGYNNGGALAVGGAIALDSATFPGALTPSVRYGLVNASTGAAGGAVTIAEATTLNLGNITASNLTASSSTGGILDSGVISLAAGGVATFTVSGNNNVVLDTTTNVIPVITLNGGVDNSITALNANTKLEATTNSTGTTTIGTNTGAAISLGNVVQTGNLVVNSGLYIDVVGNANITGNLTLNATGNVPTASALGNVYAPTATINTTTGRLTVIAGSNLPVLNYATAPTVTVTGGSIPATAAGVPTAGAGTATVTNGILTAIAVTPGANYTVAPTVALTAPAAGGTQATATATVSGGVITGFTITNAGSGYAAAPTVTLTGGGSPTTAATVVANLGPSGQISSFSVTNNGGTGSTSPFNGGNTPYVSGNPVTIDISGATTTAVAQSSGTLKVSGTTSINSTAGTANLFRGNDLNIVVMNNSTGGALINDVTSLNVSGSTAGALEVRAGANGTGVTGVAVSGSPAVEANPWAVSLGNISAGSLVVEAQNGGAGNSGTITQQSGTQIYSYGLSRFTTTNNTITLGNNGNNFGRIELNSNAGGSVNITVVEDGTMKLGNLSARGTTTLTSRFGGIIEDPSADVVISNNGTLSATAVNGSILIGNTTHTAGTTTANVVTFNASASGGAVAVTSNNSTALGNINANSLTVAVTGGNGNITQSGVVQSYGTATFSATNNITLTNNANNFGRIFLTTGSASRDIAITESGTMNLGRVTMPASSTGNFTATSVNGDIIDTGLGGVKLGGTNVSPGTGVITLAAAAGNVVLDDPTTDFPSSGGVVFNAKNVTLSPLGGATLYLGAAGQTAVATGNLTVTSATGSVYNAGAVNVSGDAFFQSGSGDIIMTNSSNNFGTVKFAGKIVSITEAGNLTMVTGSSATGAATFTTAGGSIDIANRGGTVSLASTGLFNASGNITLDKLIQVSDTLTVSAAGTKDLSKLSVSGDLGSKSPQNFGTGTYLPPLP